VASLTRIPYLWPDTNLLGVLQDQTQFGVLLDNWNHLAADLLAQHRHFDELGILETIADNRRVVICLRNNGKQFGLGACLEAEAVFPAKAEHLFNNLALLVYFDGIHTDITSFVLVLCNGRLEGIVDVFNAVAKDVAEPDQHRKLYAAQQQMIGQLFQVDRARNVFRRMDQQVSGRRDREVSLAPAVHFIKFGGIADGKGVSVSPVVAVTAGCRSTHPSIIRHF